MKKFNVVMVGAKYVSLVTGACISHIGYSVTTVDIDGEKVAALKHGEMTIYESELEEFIAKGSERPEFMVRQYSVAREVDVLPGTIRSPKQRSPAVPFVTTDLTSAEMIKYAANAFLATKISFINEISNICELVGVGVSSVATGIGLYARIGSRFLDAHSKPAEVS